jgi:uncharacterized repeat protein (TIGR01451 family)
MTAMLVSVAPAVGAAPTAPFAPRKTFNVNGAIALVGNTLLTCPTSASGCTAAKSASSGGNEVNNNNYVMTNLNVDTAGSTFNSSNSQLLMGAGSSVLWAGLYWGARLTAGTGGVAPTSPRNQMSLRGPKDTTYRTIPSSVEFGPNGTDQAYQEFADVTSIVQSEGAGTWWGANVAAATGMDRYAGWTLVVVYSNPTLPLRNLTVFDGFASVSSGNPQTISISGFLAPLAGPVQAQLGMVAYEGDLGLTGDSAQLTSGSKSTQLSTALSPGSNFFNSTNDLNGQNVTTRNPADRNMLGFDIKNFGAPSTIPNGATSATITLGTSGDQYYPGVVTTAIDLFAPDFTSSVKTVTDLEGNNPARPGDTLQYTVNLVNSGSDPANSCVLTDVLPSNTTFVSGSLAVLNGPNAGAKTDAAGDDQAEFVAGSRTVRFRLGTGASASAGGTIVVNAATTVTFQVTVDPAAAGTTVSNQATLSYVAATIGQPFTYATSTTSTPVVANADLSVTKSAVGTVNAGGSATSTMTVSNNGPNTAVNAQLSDVLPAGVVFVSASASAGSCSETGGTVTCAFGSLTNGASVTVTVVVQVPPNSTAASITDLATVTSDTNDPNLRNNTAGATTQVGTSADLVVTKTASPATAAPGQTVTFPITVHNNGPSDAQLVTLTDPLDPSQLSLVSIDRTDVCTVSGSGFSCALPSLAAGASFTVNLVAQVPASFNGSAVANTAGVAAQTPDPRPDNNNATATVSVTGPVADVSIAKSAAPATFVAGTSVTYTLSVSNPSGPSDAAGVIVTDPLPAGLTAVSAVTNLASCQLGPPVSCNLGTLFVGATATITITADVGSNAPLQPVTNTATVVTSSQDPNPADNVASVTTPVIGLADVSITKDGTGAPVAGGAISYVLTVSNSGPSTALGVTVTDTLPTALTGISAAGCTVSGQAVTCTAAQIAVDGSATFTIDATIVSTFPGGDIANTATVATSGTTDPNETNNSATFTSTAGAAADLSIAKTAPATAVAGGTVSYDLTVSNAGPSVASAATVTDPLPAGLTALSATTNQGTCALGPPVTCDLGTVGVGAPVLITITAAVDPSTQSGTVVTNTATVTSSTTDPTTSNNSDTASTTIGTQADVSVTKTLLSPTTPAIAAGQQLQFQLVVSNNGPSVARAVGLVDNLSVTARLDSLTIDGAPASACRTAAGDLFCLLGNLAPGASRTIVGTVTTDPGSVLGTYTNQAIVASLTPDPQLANNSAVVSFDINRTEADLAITKTGDPQLVAGRPFSYTITVDNTAGPSDAQDVVVTDPLPAGLTAALPVPSQGSCSVSGQVVTCVLGTIIARSEATISVTGTVDSNAATGRITNTTTVASSTPDPNQANNVASFDSTISQEADLSVTKTTDTDPLVAGTTVAYTLTVTNAGPSDASPVSLVDSLPPPISFDPTTSDVRCSGTTTVNCALGTIPVGQTVAVLVSGQIDPAFTGNSLTNTVIVSSPVTDPDPSNNTATLTSKVVQEADLSVTKVAEETSPAAGTDLTYDISVVNNGPSDAVNASFLDTLPLPPTVTPPGQGDVTCSLTGLVVKCTAPRLVAGESRTGQITIHLPANQAPGPLANTASVASDTPDPNDANNAATANVNVVLDADLTITKTVVTHPVVAGAPVTYRLDVINHGPSIAPNTLVSDPLASNVTFTSASPGCAATKAEQNITVVECALGTLQVGGTTSATVTVTPLPGATGTLGNTALVGSDALDPHPEDNTATVTSPITNEADLAVSLTGPSTVAAGGTAIFHLHDANHGPSDATNVVITHNLPAELTPNPPPGCTVAGRTLTCKLTGLLAGASGDINVTVHIDAAAPAGAVLTQNANIAADQPDADLANNTATVRSTVTRATDVAVTVTADGTVATPGARVGFTVTVTNNGPLVAHSVQLTDILPAQLTSPGDPPACAFVGNTATCALGTMAVNASTQVHFSGTLPAGTPAGTHLVDQASVTAAETDPATANNAASAATTVSAPTAVVTAAEVSSTLPTQQASPPSSAPLPSTGDNVLGTVRAALLLIALGAGSAVAGRRSRRGRREGGAR